MAETRRQRRRKEMNRRVQNRARYSLNHLNYGGIRNTRTGQGTSLDSGQYGQFRPTRIYSQSPMEILCVESWAAKNFVDIPVDDMFIRWRQFVGEDEAAIDALQGRDGAEERHMVCDKLAMALKAARQYGTGAIVLMTTEDSLETPLMPDRIRPGDLSNLLVVNRYELSITEYDYDLWSPNYHKGEIYNVYPYNSGDGLRVHNSRIIRFDGLKPSTDSGFLAYEWEWGLSELIPVIGAVMHDAGIASDVAHLAHQAGIPVLKVRDLASALVSDGFDPDTPTVDQIGQQINESMSIYRLFMTDEANEFMRVAVQFGGLPELMDRYQHRLAMAARIPITRWEGKSPGGLNATGDSDMNNYVIMMEAMRQRMLTPALRRLDMVLARDAGLREVPDFEWRSLLELGEKEQGENANLEVTAVEAGIRAGVFDEDEGRTMLDGRPVFGPLPGPAPELPEPMDEPIGGNNPQQGNGGNNG